MMAWQTEEAIINWIIVTDWNDSKAFGYAYKEH